MKTICLISLFLLKSSTPLSAIDFLIGTWQVNNKQTFETWERKDNTTFVGKGYKLVDNKEVIAEYLKIVYKDDKIIYSATVPNQNKGAAVEFVLNRSVEKVFSFENKTHDFPNKIQYEKINDNHLKAHVLNNQDKGFVLNFMRVK